MSTREPDFSPRPDPYAGSYTDLDPADAHVLALLDRDVPPMGVDLDAITAGGRRRVVRRRATIGAAVVSALTAGAVGIATLLAPHASVGIPAGQSTPTSATTGPTDMPPSEQVRRGEVRAADRSICQTSPRGLPAMTPVSTADEPALTLRPVLSTVRGATGSVPVIVPAGPGRQSVRLLDLTTHELTGHLGDLGDQNSALGQYDGRRAVYGRTVTGSLVNEVRVWDAATDTTTVIGAPDADGWGPISAPVLGADVALWTEGHHAEGGPGPRHDFSDKRRLVRYDFRTSKLDILAEGDFFPVGVIGTDVWGSDGADVVVRSNLGSGARFVEGDKVKPGDDGGPSQAVASDGTALVVASGREVTVRDHDGWRHVATIPGAGDGYLALADGLVGATIPYGANEYASVVVDLATGAHTRLDGPVVEPGSGVLTTTGSTKGTTTLLTSQAASWRDALGAACRK